ncbi:MAG: hypothetical protein ABIG71_02520 [Candidatus Uhrbacteria bacterium]
MSIINHHIRTQEQHRGYHLEHLLPALTPVVVLALAIIGYIAFLRPQLFELRSLQLRAAFASDVPALEQRLAQLERVRAVFGGELGAVQPLIDSTLPATTDVPGIIATLDAAAQRAGVVVASMELSREQPPPEFKRVLSDNEVVLIGLTVRNVTYMKLKVLLSVMSRSQRLIDTLSVQYTPKRQSATLRLRMYTMK